MMRMSRIWGTSPGSGVKSAVGAWEHATSSVASQGVANRRLTGSPRGQREPRYKAPSRTPTACIFPLLSFLMARSHGDCGVRTDRDAASADAAREAEIAEADDALLVTHDGAVAEGTVWSVFWWEAGRLRTPALALGVLPGIGRARVIALAKQVEEGRYPREALQGRSLFLTNAVRGVVPLASLDGAAVALDPRTSELARRFWPEG